MIQPQQRPSLLSAALAYFLNPLNLCRHSETAWPIENVGRHNPSSGRGRQVCTDCGRFRYYAIGVGPLSRWLAARPLR